MNRKSPKHIDFAITATIAMPLGMAVFYVLCEVYWTMFRVNL